MSFSHVLSNNLSSILSLSSCATRSPLCPPVNFLFLSLFFGNIRKREGGKIKEQKQRSKGRIGSGGFRVYMPVCLSFGLCSTVRVFLDLSLSVCWCVCFCLLLSALTVRRHFGPTSRPKAAACRGLEALWAKHRNMQSDEANHTPFVPHFPNKVRAIIEKKKNTIKTKTACSHVLNQKGNRM